MKTIAYLVMGLIDGAIFSYGRDNGMLLLGIVGVLIFTGFAVLAIDAYFDGNSPE